MDFPSLNYLAILVSGVLYMIVGALWYSSMLFAKPWMKLVGLTEEKLMMDKNAMMKTYFFSFLSSLVTAFVLDYFLTILGVSDPVEGAWFGFLAWLGFVTPVVLADVLYTKKPIKLYLINIGYPLVYFVLMGILLAIWG